MKKLLLLLCIALAFTFVSCKSTEQTTEGTETEQTVQPVEEEKAQEEEEAAPVDNANSLDSAEAARQAAIDAGAKDYYSVAFGANDAAFQAIKGADDGKDHSAELADIKARFDALANASKARKLKERIDNEGLASNAQADYDHGEKALGEFDALLAAVAVPGADLNKKAKEAYDAYYAVFFKSYKKFAIEERKNAIAQKKECDAVRAQISRKNEYTSFADLIKTGDAKFSMQNPEEAYNNYKEATKNFGELAKDVAAKRAEAQRILDEAKAKVKSSDEYAAKADTEKPLGDEQISGIESEDAVLLEKEEFANPDDQVIQIEENVEEAAK